MYKFQIKEILLRDGKTFEPGPLTIVVGPNNVGKSRFLKDVVKNISGHGTPQLLVRGLKTTLPTSLDALLEAYPHVERKIVPPQPTMRGVWIAPNLHTPGGHSCSHQWPRDFKACLTCTTDEQKQGFLLTHFGGGLIAHLTTEHRLQLLNPFNTSQAAQGQKQHLTQALYANSLATELRIRLLVKQAFNKEVALDFSEPGIMRFRVHADFNDVPQDPREAFGTLQKRETLENQGDGIRSFVGVVVALESTGRDVFLIDEPETFLHPPQAYRIGEFIGTHPKNGKQTFVATHSAEVVKGILSTCPSATILRLDRASDVTSFSFLDTDVVTELIRDPLLSSVRVIDGLFYSAAVTVEADADARFYQAVASKLSGREEVYFVNADNKQTVPRVLNAYRRAGVPSAGIVDFDALNSATVLSELMRAANVPEEQRTRVLAIREKIAKRAGENLAIDRLRDLQPEIETLLGTVITGIHASANVAQSELEIEKRLVAIRGHLQSIAEGTRPWRELKRSGRAALGSPLDAEFDELYAILAHHGMFINPSGELESMLSDVGIDATTDKRAWILRALQLIQRLLVEEQKLPWSFMRDVLHYFKVEADSSDEASGSQGSTELSLQGYSEASRCP